MEKKLWSFFVLTACCFVFCSPLHAGAAGSLANQTFSSLVAYYPLDGSAQDISGNNHHGLVTEALPAQSGYEGECYTFNGVNAFIQIPVNINADFYPQLTMGAWVKANSASPVRQVISHDNGSFDRSLGIDSRGGGVGWSAFCGSCGGVLGFEPVEIGQWVFLAVVYDQSAGTVKLYVNDKVFATSGTMGPGFDYTRIGSNPGYGEYFSGEIDNVFIFGAALDEEQLAYVRENGNKGFLQYLASKRIVPTISGLLLDE